MKPSRAAAAFILLFTVLVAPSCRALNRPVTPPMASNRLFVDSTRASVSNIAVLLQTFPSNPSKGSLRERLVQRLEVPDTAVIVLAAGVLLIFLECNLPGAIIPGSFGLLLVLSGIYGLTLHPLRPAALLGLLAAGALLSLSAKGSLPLVNAIAGAAGLIYGLFTLIPPANASLRVHLPVAACVGLVIGSSAFPLLRIADRARRNKIILAVSPRATPPNTPK